MYYIEKFVEKYLNATYMIKCLFEFYCKMSLFYQKNYPDLWKLMAVNFITQLLTIQHISDFEHAPKVDFFLIYLKRTPTNRKRFLTLM